MHDPTRPRNRPRPRPRKQLRPGLQTRNESTQAHVSGVLSDTELTPELLLNAYRHGIFPMADPWSGRIEWYCPNPRAILPLDDFHVSKNLARLVRQNSFEIRCDTAFEQVMRECAKPREINNETWIDGRFIRAYTQLHKLGHAHSVEAWKDGVLVGGLYGVHPGGAVFCGESMFSRPELGGTNASKVCLVHLVNHLRERGFVLLDTQFWNPHVDQFGCVEIPRREYLDQLRAALNLNINWGTVVDGTGTSA